MSHCHVHQAGVSNGVSLFATGRVSFGRGSQSGEQL